MLVTKMLRAMIMLTLVGRASALNVRQVKHILQTVDKLPPPPKAHILLDTTNVAPSAVTGASAAIEAAVVKVAAAPNVRQVTHLLQTVEKLPQPPKAHILLDTANVAPSAVNAANAAIEAAVVKAAAARVVSPPVEVNELSWTSSQSYISQITGFFYGLSFPMFVKALCVTGNVLVQVSPFPSVRRWDERGSTGEADSAPYVSIVFGACQWCFYGFFAWLVTSRSGFLILVHSNCLGVVLGTYYVLTFYRNCRHEEALKSLQKYLSAISALALLQVFAVSVLPSECALYLVGIISSFCSLISATSVLVTVPQVIRKKDSQSIPGPFAIANLCSSLAWTLCGYLLADPCVMMPNMFWTCCAAASLALKVMYPSREESKLLKVEEGRKEMTPSISLPEDLKATSSSGGNHGIDEFSWPIAWLIRWSIGWSVGWQGRKEMTPSMAMAAKKALSLPEVVHQTQDLPLRCGGDGSCGGTF